MGAELDAAVAGAAPGGSVAQLGSGLLGLGVAAPDAAQGAALEEDEGPDSGAVVNRVVLDVEDEAGRHKLCSVRQMTWSCRALLISTQ